MVDLRAYVAQAVVTLARDLMRGEFKQWLANQPYTSKTQATQWAQASRIEKFYGDLDAAYDLDRFTSIRASLEYSADDKRNQRKNPSKFTIDGDIYVNLSGYRSTLGVYAKFRESVTNVAGQTSVLRSDALEQLKKTFLTRLPDFSSLGFAATTGAYWAKEREYKDTVISRTSVELAAYDGDDEGLGRAMIGILSQKPANFVGYRIFRQINEAGAEAIKAINVAFGQMLLNRDDAAVVAASCASKIHELLPFDKRNPGYGQIRTLVTSGLALTRPDEAIVVKVRYMQRAALLLTGRRLFKPGVMSADEYREVLALSERLFVVMRDDWGWRPRDLWDVQGFLWVTSHNYTDEAKDPTLEDEEEDMMAGSAPETSSPNNIILYGPPGTGKTYATTAHAVELCDGSLPPGGHEAMMNRYRELVERKRISFVTFHQSYSYEDFVEGLRPETSNDEDGEEASSGGFSLRPRPGIFRQIAALAQNNRGRSVVAPTIDRNRNIFKMSLGRSADPESAQVFSDAVRDGHVVLGWGGDVDWSDSKYSSPTNIKSRWREDHPDATGADPNITQISALRSGMQVGDLVVVSDGNRKFRAIGKVTGPYQFVPDYFGTFNHRRAVQWLWHNDEGQPRELIYGKEFSQVSLYQLRSSQVDWPALEQIVSAGGEVGQTIGESEPYVLIIDEINRANVSKVFGELITLIEPDKRLGAKHALSVTLPYSGDTFGVPSNLHIIGTMNTADRSIALLDTALRRRFQFKELMPDPAILGDASAATGVDLGAVMSGLNERIEYLFDRDHQIGHAFFMSCRTLSDLAGVMRTKVVPLLAEYFYDDWEKMWQVLGETADSGTFIRRTKLKPVAGADGVGLDRERWRYEVVPSEYGLNAYEQLKA